MCMYVRQCQHACVCVYMYAYIEGGVYVRVRVCVSELQYANIRPFVIL